MIKDHDWRLLGRVSGWLWGQTKLYRCHNCGLDRKAPLWRPWPPRCTG